MPDQSQKFIWRKHVTPAWLRTNEERLAHRTGGAHALVERPGRSRLAIEFFCAHRRLGGKLRDEFGGSIAPLPSDWEEQFFSACRTKPLRIGRRLVVQSDPASEHPETNSVLYLPASAAFGTGEHATTAMSLRLLERMTRQRPRGWRMLDAGTGSGILALAGRRLGAGAVVAIDNDPLALKTAKWNARANEIRGVDFRVADITRGLAGRFDLITANLFSELLIAVLPRFKRALRQDGHLILSGVMRSQENAVRRALRANGFRVEITRRRGKWIALLAMPAS